MENMPEADILPSGGVSDDSKYERYSPLRHLPMDDENRDAILTLVDNHSDSCIDNPNIC